MQVTEARRPLKSRSTRWAIAMAQGAARAGFTPNAISVLSLLFAALGAAALLWWELPWGLLGCALGIQLRLLCNLLDGMVAMEGGLKSSVGALYNEIPDRLADSLFLVALGHATGFAWLGWLAALAAAVTAYIRVLGGSLGLPQDFRGPMAKQHRMAVMTLACLVAAAEWWWRGSTQALLVALVIIAAGAVLTCATRTLAIARRLRAT
jgi:phosphatidylglycerophosphate synthase